MNVNRFLVTFTAATTLLLGASMASAATAYCYKHKSNNEYRYIFTYEKRAGKYHIYTGKQQKWKNGRYKTIKSYNYKSSFGLTDRGNACRSISTEYVYQG